MPAGNGTGPLGRGPMTGRGIGYCGGYAAAGWANPGPGRRSFGRGFYGRGGQWGGRGPGRGGGGWGYRHWYHATGLPRWARRGTGTPYAPPSQGQEVEMLKDEAEWLKGQLDAISQRMDELSQE